MGMGQTKHEYIDRGHLSRSTYPDPIFRSHFTTTDMGLDSSGCDTPEPALTFPPALSPLADS